VGLFRKREETLNDKLLREAGYSPEGTPATPVPSEPDTAQGWHEQPLEVVATVEVPELAGDAYEFVTIPDGSLIVDDTSDADLSRLADAVERQLRAPYKATAARQDDSVWLVTARAIDVERIVADGDELELSSVGGTRTFKIDGRAADEQDIPWELLRLGEATGADFVVRALWLDEDLWEVHADPL
jgi:hypothetical protein